LSSFLIASFEKETGFKGFTPLFNLKKFNYIENVGIDAMHNIVIEINKIIPLEINCHYF